MFGMDKTRNAGLFVAVIALVLLAARGARGLLYCVSRAGGLLLAVGIAAIAYGLIRKNG